MMTGLLAALVFCGALRAEGDDRRGKVRGTFVKRVERKVGEREYLAIVIKPLEGKRLATLLIPRRNKDLMSVARKLRQGQKLALAYVTEADHKWVRRIEVARADDRREKERPDRRRRENDRERAERKDKDKRKGEEGEHKRVREREHEDAALRKQVRNLLVRVERIEKQLRQLREQNAHLKRMLAEPKAGKKEQARPHKEGKRRDKPRPGARGGLPDGIRGFRGMLVGTVAKKLDLGFVLRVGKIGKVWRKNKAKNPKAAIGKELRLVLPAKSRLGERHRKTLRSLKAGDRVSVEAIHYEGNHLTIVEELRKID